MKIILTTISIIKTDMDYLSSRQVFCQLRLFFFEHRHTLFVSAINVTGFYT